MDGAAQSPRDRANAFDAGVLVVVAAITGFLFVGLFPETIRFLLGMTRGVEPALIPFWDAVFGVVFLQLLSRVIRREFAWPTGWPLAANVLDSVARGWGIGLAFVSARDLGDALAHFGAPSVNRSYVADAFYFLLVTLVFAMPGLAALWLARRVA